MIIYVGATGRRQVCLKWEAEDAADDDVDGFQLLVDGVPVGEPLKKSARQVTIDELKPGQELDVSLVPLDGSRQPLSSSNVIKARAFFSCTFQLLCINGLHKSQITRCSLCVTYFRFSFNRPSLRDLLRVRLVSQKQTFIGFSRARLYKSDATAPKN